MRIPAPVARAISNSLANLYSRRVTAHADATGRAIPPYVRYAGQPEYTPTAKRAAENACDMRRHYLAII